MILWDDFLEGIQGLSRADPPPLPVNKFLKMEVAFGGWAPYIHELCANVGSAATVTGGELVWVGPAK